ncbi:hypothetical protein SGM_4190 [Streptomyces griseoaurantiacus M045]|uniref:Uncharacterized protein n=1 Tax=Streptomyces griseoaurantiacus M045 TaxID=996637 RepID=F3NLT5_9ACTN|nr:hypothetical protein SGM_4190 [Streptomyces griseoaurantiacus M045]
MTPGCVGYAGGGEWGAGAGWGFFRPRRPYPSRPFEGRCPSPPGASGGGGAGSWAGAGGVWLVAQFPAPLGRLRSPSRPRGAAAGRTQPRVPRAASIALARPCRASWPARRGKMYP